MSESLLLRISNNINIISNNIAILHIIAPIGSTINISKNNILLKILKPKESSTSNENNDYANYYYYIQPGNFGTFLCEAILGEDTATANIEIQEFKQYELSLSFQVPYSYQALEYLTTTTGAWFDTGIIPTTTNYTVKTNIQVENSNGGYIFGVEGGYFMRNPSGYDQLYWGYNSGSTYFAISGIRTVGNKFEIIYNAAGGAIIVNGVQKASHSNISALASRQYSILVSAARYGTAVDRNFGSWRYENFQVLKRDTEELLCDLWPCQRKSDLAVGFWDTISKTFKTNQGGGTVSAGPTK